MASTCGTVEDGLEEKAAILASIYESKVDIIVKHMQENGLSDFFGELPPQKVIASLGRATIDLNRNIIMYLEQTLDDIHIIELQYSTQFSFFVCREMNMIY